MFKTDSIEIVLMNLTAEQRKAVTIALSRDGFCVSRSGHVCVSNMEVLEWEVMGFDQKPVIGFMGGQDAQLVNRDYKKLKPHHDRLRRSYESVSSYRT